jgi:hypothetical protein
MYAKRHHDKPSAQLTVFEEKFVKLTLRKLRISS